MAHRKPHISMNYTAKIYKIVNDINEDFYVGSTRNELRKRLCDHKSLSKKYPQQNGLYEMLDTYDHSHFRIVLICEVKCKWREDQMRQEQMYIDQLKPVLNRVNRYAGFKCAHDKVKRDCKECVRDANKKKVRCDTCDCEVRRDGLAEHEKTKKHLNKLREIVVEEQKDIE